MAIRVKALVITVGILAVTVSSVLWMFANPEQATIVGRVAIAVVGVVVAGVFIYSIVLDKLGRGD